MNPSPIPFRNCGALGVLLLIHVDLIFLKLSEAPKWPPFPRRGSQCIDPSRAALLTPDWEPWEGCYGWDGSKVSDPMPARAARSPP